MPQPVSQGVDITAEPGNPDYALSQAMLQLQAEKLIPFILPLLAPALQEVTPESGDTVVLTSPTRNGILMVHGTTPLTSLTLQLPPDSDTVFGQTRMICAEVDIMGLSIELPGTEIRGAPETMSAEDNFVIQKIGPELWTKLAI